MTTTASDGTRIRWLSGQEKAGWAESCFDVTPPPRRRRPGLSRQTILAAGAAATL